MWLSAFITQIGGACRLFRGIKSCGQLLSNEILFADSWFSGVKTAKDVTTKRVDYFGWEKTSYKGFCLNMLEKSIK